MQKTTSDFRFTANSSEQGEQQTIFPGFLGGRTVASDDSPPMPSMKKYLENLPQKPGEPPDSRINFFRSKKMLNLNAANQVGLEIGSGASDAKVTT